MVGFQRGKGTRAAILFGVTAVLHGLVTQAQTTAPLVQTELRERSRAYLESKTSADHERLIALAEKSSGSAKALALFAAGMGDRVAEKHREAAKHLADADAGLGDLAHYAAYYRVQSLAKAEDHTAAAAAAADFLKRFPESRFARLAAQVRAESLIRAERREEARRFLESSREVTPEPARLYGLARIVHLDGKLLEAVRAYRRVYYHYPFSDQAEEAETRLNALRRRLGGRYPKAPPRWRLARADALLKSRKFSKAAQEYAWAIPGLASDDLERAQVRLASADYGRRHTTRAYQRLKPLQVKDRELDAERIYIMGECARRLRRIKEFRGRAEELGERYPTSKWYEEALFSLGNYYLLEQEPALYRRYYERSARAFPQGEYAARAHWKVCWRAYLDRDPRTRSLFAEHVALHPRSASACGAIYWAARLEQRDDPARARQLYTALVQRFPHYYYGYRARHRLRNLTVKRAGPTAEPPAFLSLLPPARNMAPRPSEDTAALIRRGSALHALGLSEDAATELRTGDYRKPDGHWIGLELAEQYAELGRHHLGLRMMKRYGFGYLRMPFESMPREFWRRLFPMPYENRLRARAKPHGLDPYLLAALIRQESEFNPSAISYAGARGLMQIMPATGKRLARRLGIKGFSTRHLYRADTSLRLGTFHFRKVHDQFERRIEYTLAAYNAGEHRVEEWLTWEDFADAEEFAETIPFTQTRGYVQAVFRNAEVYRALYGESEKKIAALRGLDP